MAAYRHLGVSLGVKALGINDVILLRTRGRRTGQVREVLVAYVELGGVPVVCGGNAGWDGPPGWFENLREGGPVEVEYRDHRRIAVIPVILSGGAREQAFAVVYHALPTSVSTSAGLRDRSRWCALSRSRRRPQVSAPPNVRCLSA